MDGLRRRLAVWRAPPPSAGGAPPPHGPAVSTALRSAAVPGAPLLVLIVARLALLLAPMLTSGAAQAAETRPLSADWMRDQWTIADGLPLNHINDVLVDEAGVVWLATYDGLVRFDGQRFETLRVGAPDGPQSNRLRYLARHPQDGALWLFGDDNSLQRRIGGQVTSFAGRPGPWGGPPLTTEGTIWAAVGGELLRLDDRPTRVEGAPAEAVYVRALPGGALGIVDFHDRAWALDPRAAPARPAAAIDTIGPGAPIEAQLRARTGLSPALISTTPHRAIEADGALWVTSTGDGLLRLRPRTATAHRPPGAGRSNVRALWWEEPTRTLWFHVEGGEWWSIPSDGSPSVSLQVPPAVRGDCNPGHDRPFTGTDGRRWLRPCYGLWRAGPAGWERQDEPPLGFSGPVWELPDGTGWLSGERTLYLMRGGGVDEQGADLTVRWAAIDGPDGPPAGVRGLAPLPSGETAAGGSHGLWVIAPGPGPARRLDADAPLGGVRHLRATGAHLWISTTDRGLCVAPLPGGAAPPSGAPLGARCLGPESSFGRATVHATLTDAQGRLWISSNQGLGLSAAQAAGDFATGAADDLPVLWLGVGDGLLDAELNGFVGDAALVRPTDGHLWFASQDGAVEVDPTRVQLPAPPTVQLLAPQLGATRLPLGAPVGLPTVHPPLRLTWSTPASAWADQHELRYRLGPDGAWSSPGRGRAVELASLPPGASTFEVQARIGGAWGPVSRLALSRAPALHERAIFPLLVGLGVVITSLGGLGLWSAAQRRTRRRLEALVAAQTVELEARYRSLQSTHAELAEVNGALADRVAELDERGEALRVSNRQIAAQAAQLQELDQLKRQLIANLSHELRTPLSLILGPLASLRDEAPPDSRARRHLGLAVSNAERLQGLIAELFELSRAQAGGLRLRARRVELGAWLRGLGARFEPAATEAQRRLRVLSPAAPLVVWMDPDLMEKVVSNLLVNALRHAPEGGAVELSARGVKGGEQGLAQIVVEDDGPGVPDALQDAVFERFLQIEGGAERPQGGAGIGLALAKELVELHGGQIRARRGHVGARFSVELPIGVAHLGPDDVALEPAPTATPIPAAALAEARPADEQGEEDPGAAPINAPSPGSAAAARTPSPAGSARARVLLVEDHDELRGYLAEHLAERFEVCAVASGAEALAAVEAQPFALVISDVMMPGMDGHALAHHLRTRPGGAPCPLLFISARQELHDRVAGLELADDYLPKPFQVPELLARAAALLRRGAAAPPAALDGDAAPAQVEAGEAATPASARAAALRARLIRVTDPNLADPEFNVGALARAAGMSPRTLQAHMQEAELPPPVEWLRVRRLEHAAQLLQSGALAGVAEVAAAVGMSRSYFSRAYAAHTGRAPTDDLRR